MSCTQKYRPQRFQYWPEVEQFFGNLPPHLFRQGTLLKNNLAISYSHSGQFKDILCRDGDHPLLYLHFWLLDDLGFPKSAERAALERHLFLAMVFTIAAIFTQESILDHSTSFDNDLLLLERTLTQQADFHLAQLYPGQSPFWSHFQAFWQEYAEATLASSSITRYSVLSSAAPAPAGDPDSLLELAQVAGQLAFTKIPVAAVAVSAGQEAAVAQLCTMMDRLNFILQNHKDIITLRRDLMRRDYTYPIVRTILEAGIDPRPPYIPEQILGASVLTGSIEKTCQESLTQLNVCRSTAEALGLPTFIAYFAVVENLISEVMGLFRSGATPSVKTAAGRVSHKQSKPRFLFHANSVVKAVEMAEGYLLSDLSFRESWDVQRGWPQDLPELVGKSFPSGLIIEVLCQHGHDLTDQVGAVFKTLHQNRFRYYDYERLPPDADDLGLLLRLYRFSGPGQREAHRDILQAPLRWMKDSILPSGEIPVWLALPSAAQAEHVPLVFIWGSSCTTTETNLLLGLIGYNWAEFRRVIENSALSLLERIRLYGLGASLYYLPPYTLWTSFELLAQLSTRPVQEPLGNTLRETSNTLFERFDLETKKPDITPQDAAFLTLTCCGSSSFHQLEHLFKESWIRRLLKSQRHDGSWNNEPLFLIPDHRGTAWYASRSVTTAFCYHALRNYQTAR